MKFATLRPSLVTVALSIVAALLSACHSPALPPADARQLPFALAASGARPERLLPLAKTYNTRDLGGYTTVDGRRVKWGQLYRADALDGLDSEDVAYLARLGLRRVVDFRSEREREAAPDRLPAGVEYQPYPITPRRDEGSASYRLFRNPEQLSAAAAVELVREGNRQLVRVHTPLYREWLRQLASEDSASPQLFHCTAGKDRTGFAAAILLAALGVPREQIIADYLLSAGFAGNEERRQRIIRQFSMERISAEALRPLMTVDASYLQAAFEEAERSHGSFDAYLAAGLGVDASLRSQLRARFLEPVPPAGS